MEKQKCPEIRFKGFNEAWEFKKLEEVGVFNPYSSLPQSFEYVDLESVVGTELIGSRNETIDSAPSRAQRLARKGDVFYQAVRPYQKNNYLFDLPYDNYVFSTGYIQIRPNINSRFLLNLVQKNDFVLRVLENCTGTSYPAINTTGLKNIDAFISSCVDEQAQLGNFFQNLDQSIALHEKKLVQTQNFKKAMLEKMFPKQGSKRPEIRLKGFSGDWNIEAIGDVLHEVFRPINLDNETKYRLVTVKRRNGGIAERAILKGKDILVKSQFEVKAGDYIISKRQVVHGATGLVPLELDGSVVSNEYLVGQGTEKLSIEFFALLSTLPEMYQKFFLSSYGVDIEKLFFDVNDWNKREVLLPSLEEQVQISTFFKQVDETLNLQQQQLQTLKNLKQAFLEKMFV
ncbi:restriction endonuclease subunit S [Acinetobacter pittii]|uniref:restriction endonuclease subunit S n=1 Tax=Acinetobacter pittii TaxID=48296 RepID=UPI00355C9DEC